MCAYECVVHAHTGAQVCACLCTCARVQVCVHCVHVCLVCTRVSVCASVNAVYACRVSASVCRDMRLVWTGTRVCVRVCIVHTCMCVNAPCIAPCVCMFACVHTCLCMCLACAHGRLVRVCACVRAGVCGLGGGGWPAQARFPLWRRPPVATGKIAPQHAVPPGSPSRPSVGHGST